MGSPSVAAPAKRLSQSSCQRPGGCPYTGCSMTPSGRSRSGTLSRQRPTWQICSGPRRSPPRCSAEEACNAHLVIRRMQEDYRLTLSLGYIHDCFIWAHAQINMAAHWEFVRAHFSGVLCLDEVHGRGRTILFATDALGDFTVSFKLVEQNDQDHMDAFLQALKDRGLDAQVIMTDGSPLYKDALQRYWYDVEHQLCIFHVIKEVNKLLLDGVRAIKNRIKCQGNKGRKKRRGRPTKQAQQH